MPITVEGDKRVFVTASLGLRQLRMLVDTGADAISIPEDIAEALIEDRAAEYTGGTVRVRIADGSVHEARVIKMWLHIGRHSLQVIGSVEPTGSDILLPFPVLNQLGRFTINTRRGLLIFG